MLAANTLLQNRYRIKRAIAKGGMGMVYEAEAIHLGNTIVAVKETFFDEDELREQFEREATVLAKLRHPALPKVTDHFSEGAGQFLVMEFIPGDDLEKLLKNRGEPFPTSQALEWADCLLNALDYIHTQYPPVIHRDIKPSNLKLTPRGELMLLDFGLAKNATTPTRPGGSVHAYTQGFAPPEQINGTGTDVRCDIYSLGATLYNLMTGNTPSDSKLRAEMMAVPMPDPLKPSHLVKPDIPMPISVVIARAMAVDREQRYPSAKAMREALKQAKQSIEDALKHEQERKAEAARLLAEQARLAEDARRRAEAETERVQRDEAEQRLRDEAARLKKEKAEIERKLSEATAGRQKEEAERLKKEKEATQLRQQAEAERRKHEEAERRRKEEEKRLKRPVPTGRRAVVVAAAVLLACLLGYWIWNASQSGDGKNQAAVGPSVTPTTTPKPSPAVAAQSVEVLRYAQRFEPNGSFRLRFTPQRNGYLYLVALDDKGIPITFLTNHHAYDANGSSNRLTAGSEFVFPPKTSLTWKGNKQTAELTLIFSPVKLNQPGFLDAASWRELTAAEMSALETMKQSADRSPQTEPIPDGETVKALPGDKPLVIEITVRKTKHVKGS